jgi:hypothetical protein
MQGAAASPVKAPALPILITFWSAADPETGCKSSRAIIMKKMTAIDLFISLSLLVLGFLKKAMFLIKNGFLKDREPLPIKYSYPNMNQKFLVCDYLDKLY